MFDKEEICRIFDVPYYLVFGTQPRQWGNMEGIKNVMNTAYHGTTSGCFDSSKPQYGNVPQSEKPLDTPAPPSYLLNVEVLEDLKRAIKEAKDKLDECIQAARTDLERFHSISEYGGEVP